MKVFRLIVACALLSLGCTMANGATNRYNISDENLARLQTASAKVPSDFTVSVGDSMMAEGRAADDLGLVMAGNSLRIVNAAMTMDTTAVPFMREQLQYARQRKDREGWDTYNAFNYFINYVDLINYVGLFGNVDEAVRLTYEMRSHVIEDPTGIGQAITDHAQGMLYNNRQDIALCLKYLQKAEEEFQHLEIPESLTRVMNLYRYVTLSNIYTLTNDYERGLEYGRKAQAIMPSIVALTMTGNALLQMGRREEFQAVYDSIAQLPTNLNTADATYIKWLDWYRNVADGRYEEARKMIPEIFITENNKISTTMFLNAAEKDWQGAYQAARKMMNYTDSVFLVIHEQDLAAIEAHYEVEFKTLEKEKELMRQRYLLIGSVVTILLVLVILAIVIKRNRDIARKNRALVQNINDLLDSRKQMQKVAPISVPAESEDGETDASNRFVRQYLHELISRQLYCKTDFNRDDLLSELHLPKTNFWKMFEQETGQQFAPYLLNLRLEHAAELIREHPEWTIEAIANESGFATRSTFYSNFTSRFGISPAVYRSELGK